MKKTLLTTTRGTTSTQRKPRNRHLPVAVISEKIDEMTYLLQAIRKAQSLLEDDKKSLRTFQEWAATTFGCIAADIVKISDHMVSNTMPAYKF